VSATTKNEMQPAIYRFSFGNFEITNILDGKVIRQGLHPAYGPERSAEEARALCFANNIDSRELFVKIALPLANAPSMPRDTHRACWPITSKAREGDF
jgi:hypothetical protein